jgi:hypothetical protein
MDYPGNPAAHAAALWAALSLFVLLALSGLVVRQRRRHRVALGDDGVPELVRAQRAFGNACEYIPAGLAALAVLVVVGAGPAEVHAVGAVLFTGRVAHGVGLSLTGGPSIGRTVGMLLTWLAWLLAAVCLLLYAL